VQSVGFRPFVRRLATELDLSGAVRDDGGTVVIDAVGDPDDLAEFLLRLRQDAPPTATVAEIVERGPTRRVDRPAGEFAILPSAGAAAVFAEIPPDAAICDACLTELFTPDDRRYRYPFINCADCGPRATVIDGLPYDRSRTSMAEFPLCTACAAEYQDPSNRRFHAESVGCPVCGPALVWRSPSALPDISEAVGGAALTFALARLRAGGIVAVKGLGGYQLVCDASDEDGVRRLRAAKQRPHEAFAVMASEMADIRAVACVTSFEERLLTSTARPIVLLRRWPGHHPHIAEAVAPAAPRLGLFLPATPLHHLLLRGVGRPLVVTSGSLADAATLTDDAEALERLGPLCDGILAHDRPIRARHDDSIARTVLGRPALVRRARVAAARTTDR
jgi:hydrogenase maturation protein HypF